jgi:hypothetical protein
VLGPLLRCADAALLAALPYQHTQALLRAALWHTVVHPSALAGVWTAQALLDGHTARESVHAVAQQVVPVLSSRSERE